MHFEFKHSIDAKYCQSMGFVRTYYLANETLENLIFMTEMGIREETSYKNCILEDLCTISMYFVQI
jgi:hypothetical protein